jgi:serine/threonine protein kinase/Tol biopolymer transport system component
MALTSGDRLGPYEIVSPIGAGGMGEVYKARDPRLDRTVAIKVMPPRVAGDPEMKQRFEREARTIAGLSHPNICTLHDIGEATSPGSPADKIQFLVMEFLEGETLADRLARARSRSSATPVPGASSASGFLRSSGSTLGVDESMRIAIAIADALATAHRQGIIHRDLKPSNVMLVRGGSTAAPLVKLLDFGLAKWTTEETDGLGAMPTRADVTAPGMILGTLQYMAPEQVEGKEADARTDIFALGALLHEMLTGRKAFEGKSQATLISAIMTGDPPPASTLQPLSPPALDHVITRCLAKDPDDRWQDARSVLAKLRWVASSRAARDVAADAGAHPKRDRLARVILACAGVLIAVLSAPAVLYLRGPEPAPPFALRVPVVGLSRTNFAVSPNGREIAVVAQPDPLAPSSLYVRPIHTPTFRRLSGTEDAEQPFWSPDSRSIAFVTSGKLRRIDAAGGAPKDLASISEFFGGTWQAGTILFGSPTGIFRVSAEGGTPQAVTTVEKPETGHFWPSFLPDGRHYFYLAWSREQTHRAVYVAALDTKDRSKLMAGDSNVVYAMPGYALFVREGSLVAQPFDANARSFGGDAVQVAGSVAYSSADGRGAFDVSQTGVLVSFQGALVSGPGQTQNMEFAWVTRTGARLARGVEAGPHGDMDVSPDLRFIALTRHEPGAAAPDIWIIDWQKGGNPVRLTIDPAADINPVWSPDGTRIAFSTYRNGNADIFVKNANGVGEEQPLLQTAADEVVEAWSKDGRYLAYLSGTDRYQDIYALPLFGDRKLFPVVQGPYRKNEPQFSYDGKWLAYTADQASPGQFDVYVISFPGRDQLKKVSVGGGGQPRWRRDGKELFYRTVSAYMAAEFSAGPPVDSGIPYQLFSTQTPGGGNATSSDPTRHQWAASPDGQRFLVRVPPGSTAPSGRLAQSPTAVNSFNPPDRAPGSSATVVAPTGRFQRGLGAPTLNVVLAWAASLDAGRR